MLLISQSYLSKENGSSTRSVLKACVKALRDTVDRLETSLEESEPLLDLEVQEDARTETESIEDSTDSEDNANIEQEKVIDGSIEHSS